MYVNPAYWVDHLDPVAIHLPGGYGIRYYSLAYLLAFVAAYVMLRRAGKAGRSPFSAAAADDAIFALGLGVMVGGRLGYMLLYSLPELFRDPLSLFRIWEGGMSSHGGFVGVAAATWWLSRKHHISFRRLGDLLCPIAPFGLLLGRVANFINGELWGRVSYVPWAVVFPSSAPGTPIGMIAPRHPSQIYEALLEGALLLFYGQWRFWRTAAARTPGRLSGEFLLLYALVRTFGEQFREPDAAMILGMSRGTFYSLFLIPAGALLIALSCRTYQAQWGPGPSQLNEPS